MSAKPSLPKGTRDFGPAQMAQRTYIIETIRGVFQRYGFMPLETPAMENLSVLTGKYGDEGDQLLFRILNSGDFLSKTTAADYEAGARALSPKISEKGLKYDLTVPFARYVVQNQHNLAMPFKRFQIQPVWRADRPQRGRYREFYQCDADVVGTDSLLCEVEIIWMIREAFKNLGITDYDIKINHRKVLSGIAEAIGASERFADLCVAIDKLDKIGAQKVLEELNNRGFSQDSLSKLTPFLAEGNDNPFKSMDSFIGETETGKEGLKELREVFSMLGKDGEEHMQFDPQLARGLSYYTGCIFEVKVNNVKIGSVSGGGRYDNLTGAFGLPGVSGVGFSFGIDRIYDVMEELELFPATTTTFTSALLVAFDEQSWKYCLEHLPELREAGIRAELYPNVTKPKKQFGYADKKGIPFCVIAGDEEVAQKKFSLKNMGSGEQATLDLPEVIEQLIAYQNGQ